jgi:hypothetical protein
VRDTHPLVNVAGDDSAPAPGPDGGSTAVVSLEIPKSTAVVRMAPHFLRRRDTAAALSVSETVVLQWERAGWLTPIRLPGLRSVRHWREEVDQLARRLKDA